MKSMHTPPKEVSVGDYLTQDDIEEIFDTGFGYRISGINPRRDSQDRRYVLVFANEDGPYDDSVKQGQFEYIGEGLEGDQSKSSPGNSTLIDAISSGIPVHFFYQQSGNGEWEYQGLVDVLDYDTKEQDGREVIIFKMVHRDNLRQEDDLSWIDAIRLELERYQEQEGESVVTLREIYDFSEHRLSTQFPDNNHIRAKGPSSFCLNRIRYEPAAIGVRAGGERRNRGAKTPALNSEFNKHLVGGSRRLAILRFGGADDE
ncbi:putative protein 15 [Haloarcula hispanica pleomorphic virus 3]|uniref:ScoMcrA-like SRA domain-containing protein n=1 Tax=Haloarcula hispanica pleomorphic virus 3 TaxID=1879051 RepID=A0A1C8V5Z3_9VIRU|nr:putative protein 15 [Haloarcula hispanica pleomorphic virus 3]ANW09676.1 putative protein 15 [Haloarcula hispanica pleomorphic virus 3]